MRNWYWYIGMAVFVAGAAYVAVEMEDFQPAQMLGSPLRKGDRVYLITGQWRSRLTNLSRRSSSNAVSALHVDLQAFDAGTAAPLWRKELHSERGAAMTGWSILGADGDTLWVLGTRGLMAVSLTDGQILADAAALQRRNSALETTLPMEERYYRFGAQGLHFKAADGGEWWLDSSLTARPNAPDGPRTLTPVSYFTPFHASSFRERGLRVGNQWLGLLTEAEAESYAKNNVIGGLDYESRRRLWRAKVVETANFFGKQSTLHDFQPLGPEFLAPALLALNMPTGPNRVLWYRDPDSVLVLHRDRLDQLGKLRLSRVAGPEGRVVWDAHLPLSMLQGVMPGERSISLIGVEYQPAPGQGPRDPMHDAVHLLVGIDLALGRVGSFDISAADFPNEAK